MPPPARPIFFSFYLFLLPLLRASAAASTICSASVLPNSRLMFWTDYEILFPVNDLGWRSAKMSVSRRPNQFPIVINHSPQFLFGFDATVHNGPRTLVVCRPKGSVELSNLLIQRRISKPGTAREN